MELEIINKLFVERVINVGLSSDKEKLIVTECCDEWYQTDLNKKEVGQLIEELSYLKNQMKE